MPHNRARRVQLPPHAAREPYDVARRLTDSPACPPTGRTPRPKLDEALPIHTPAARQVANPFIGGATVVVSNHPSAAHPSCGYLGSGPSSSTS